MLISTFSLRKLRSASAKTVFPLALSQMDVYICMVISVIVQQDHTGLTLTEHFSSLMAERNFSVTCVFLFSTFMSYGLTRRPPSFIGHACSAAEASQPANESLCVYLSILHFDNSLNVSQVEQIKFGGGEATFNVLNAVFQYFCHCYDCLFPLNKPVKPDFYNLLIRRMSVAA